MAMSELMPEFGPRHSGNSRDYRMESPDPVAIVRAWIRQPPLIGACSWLRCDLPWSSDWLPPVCSWRHVAAAAVPRRQPPVVHPPERARHRHSSPASPSTASRCRRGRMVGDLHRVDLAGHPLPARLLPRALVGVLRLVLAASAATRSFRRPSRPVPASNPRVQEAQTGRTARRSLPTGTA